MWVSKFLINFTIFCLLHPVAFGAVLRENDKEPEELIVLDIDPGVDDIEGLVMLLNEHNKGTLKIVTIVISDGNTLRSHGINNVFRILDVAQRLDIPVYPGSFSSILPHSDTVEPLENFFGSDGFGDLHWQKDPPIQRLRRSLATDKLQQIVSRNPGKITYIALGPQTNLALCMRLYEGFAGKLKRIYAMAGLYVGDHDYSEFNVRFDPESFEIVFAMLKCPMTIFTWQACLTNPPKRVWFENETISNPIFDMVLRAEESVKQMHPDDPQWISCDPMTVAAYLKEDIIIQSYESPLMVHLNGPERGIIDNSTSARFPVKVIMEIDYPKAEKIFLDAFDEVCKTRTCQDKYQ